MLNLLEGRKTRNCAGVSRRAALKIGSLPVFGLSLPRLLEAKARQSGSAQKDVNCLLLWLDGGISTIDTWDMKPDAPPEYRGEFQPIAANLPGMTVCEHLPRVARHLDKICQVRTVVHSGSQHAEASHFMQTGYFQVPGPPDSVSNIIHPSFGSVVSKQLGWQNGMPPYVRMGGIKYSGAGFLGSAYNPLAINANPNADDFRIEDVSIPNAVGPGRTKRRRELLQSLDALRGVSQQAGGVYDRNQFLGQAYDLMTSPTAKKAFRIDEEPDELRDRYGRHEEGQRTLLGRRLIEAGVRFVSVSFNGYDTHDKNFIELRRDLLPKLDQAYSALLEDMGDRGLLENTLVLCFGEFGRTPKVNGAAGRDHYPKVNNINFSGAGVKTGTVVGRTSDKCDAVVGREDSTHDLAATLYKILGVDYDAEYMTPDNRPILVTDNGRPIPEVLS